MNLSSRKIAVPLLLFAASFLSAQAPFATKTPEVMVLVAAKPGIQREQIIKLAPEEVRATVRLYLDGKISQWYSRSDGKGIILIVKAKSVAEAQAITESLPLSKANLVDHEFTELGPLGPLHNLVDSPSVKQ
jgi:hypothetical protein